MNKRVYFLASLLLVCVLMSSMLVSAESAIAEKPGFGSSIILKAKQILHLNNDLMNKIYNANRFYFFNGYGPNVDSAKVKYLYQTYYNEYRICANWDETLETNCTMKAEAKKASYDDLPLYENYATIRAFKKPDKQIEYSETDNYLYNKFDQLTFWLIDGNNSYQWSYQNPNTLLIHENPSSIPVVMKEEDVEKALKEFVGTNPRLRKTNLDGREVLEIYVSESSSHPSIDRETFVYFDANDYKFIKEVERTKETYDLLISKKEISFINLKQRIQTFSDYSANISDSDFTLWDGTMFDTPDLTNLSKCYPPYYNNGIPNLAATKAIDLSKQMKQLEDNLSEKENREYNLKASYEASPGARGMTMEEWKETRKEYGPYDGVTEEDWNNFNLLRTEILKVTCRNSEPISYEQYKKLREFQLQIEGYPGDLSWGRGYSNDIWMGPTLQELLQNIKIAEIDTGRRLED